MMKWIRRFKPAYEGYNFFHRSKLSGHQKVLAQLGIRKKYYSSLSAKDFEHLNLPPLGNIPVEKIKQTKLYQQSDPETQQSLLTYNETGFSILKQFVSADLIEEINTKVDEGLNSGTLEFVNKNKIMFAFHKIPALKTIGQNPLLTDLLDVLLHGKAKLFQSINFKSGSEQDTHSDSIHMTTYPLGGLLGVWVALEDIDEDNGPLHYYPGSHLLPYYLNKDYDNEGSRLFLGPKDYDEYEAFIQKKIAEQGLTKKIFTAKKGDVLIWHANLFHGGEPHTNKNKSRKSVVFHYFKEGVVCYHEITQRPALMVEYE